MVKYTILAVSVCCAILIAAFFQYPQGLWAQDATPAPSPTVVSASKDAKDNFDSHGMDHDVNYHKDPSYKELGIHTGVWNDGQAALWDLSVADHFGIFGPEERHKGHKPEQPIRFSHILHVQKNKMDCQFCHWSVAKASYAAIPEVETCMGCHKLVQGHSEGGKADVKKIKEYYDAAKPIPWIKVHVMPDHVKFNHKRHVKSGIPCSSCHGQIQEMEVVERVSSMKMGWCMECHRQKGASIDCMTCHGSR